ncbi:MAG: hypothetical protein MRY21_02985 [Simkaniaceae bacterium]|nr:hypothetical protein [Simkaniaceae bacterium]
MDGINVSIRWAKTEDWFSERRTKATILKLASNIVAGDSYSFHVGYLDSLWHGVFFTTSESISLPLQAAVRSLGYECKVTCRTRSAVSDVFGDVHGEVLDRIEFTVGELLPGWRAGASSASSSGAGGSSRAPTTEGSASAGAGSGAPC